MADLTEVQKLIRTVCDELCEFLLEKNRSYGNSALDPIRIFSRADPLEQIAVRIDDKLSRLKNGHGYPGDNDVKDLAGYLVLRMVAERFQANWVAPTEDEQAAPSCDFGVNPEDSASLQRLRECIDDHGVWPDGALVMGGDYELCVKFMANEIRQLNKMASDVVGNSQTFTYQGTTYYRADHPRVLREDEFRVHNYLATMAEVGVNHDAVPVVIDNRGREWCPWVVPLIEHPGLEFLRACWLANYQFAPGEYLDEEAGVVRQREPEPEESPSTPPVEAADG